MRIRDIAVGIAVAALCIGSAVSATHEDDKAAIRAVLDAGCKGFIAGDVAGAMSPYSKKAYVFDMTPKLHSTYQDVWQGNVDLIKALDGAPTCGYREMEIVVDHNHAYAHYLLPFKAKLKSGKTLDVVERTVDIFEKIDGKWLIVVEHNSVPVDVVNEKMYLHAAG